MLLSASLCASQHLSQPRLRVQSFGGPKSGKLVQSLAGKCKQKSFEPSTVSAPRGYARCLRFRPRAGQSNNSGRSEGTNPEDEKKLGNGEQMLSAEELMDNKTKGKDSGSGLLSSSFEEGFEPADFKSEPQGYTRQFIANRLLVFAGLVLGYSCFYITRNSFIYTAPVMVDAGVINMTQVGVLTSMFPIAYGMSKFVSGVLGDLMSPATLLAVGLLSTAVVNFGFGLSGGMVFFIGFWAGNGLLQGVGAPSCARMLSSWFAPAERGTYWGMWNVAHNFGGFLAPLVAGFAARTYGWRYGLFIPATIAAVVSVILFVVMKDSPEKAGYTPVASDMETKDDKKESQEKPNLWKSLKENVLTQPSLYLLAACYFFVYTVRQGVTSWFVFYLIQAKGVPDAAVAAVRVSGLELGGLAGSLLAGRLSDMLIRNCREGEGTVGMRIRVVAGYCLGLAAMLGIFTTIPGDAGALQWLTVFMIGFFIYGPQMLVGLCGAEIAGPKAVGASQGFLGWIAYLGAANAGVPISILVKNFGWGAFFTALMASSLIAFMLLVPILNQKSFRQKRVEAGLAA
mmetsp:Transcript_5298/g.12909  ORF Transcript_5298/g.12909 Transcript_5298/m.12909 type:complete len:568 (-) Transcript_5298:203-1906(-)